MSTYNKLIFMEMYCHIAILMLIPIVLSNCKRKQLPTTCFLIT